jgi:hypothetical protein
VDHIGARSVERLSPLTDASDMRDAFPMMASLRIPLSAVAVVAVVACGSCSSTGSGAHPVPAADAGPGAVAPRLTTDCDPLVPTHCGFPFPSNVWLTNDPATHTGKHVSFGATTLPFSLPKNVQTDPEVWTESDGFSPDVGILTHVPGATVTGLPTPDTIDASLDPNCPTVLIEADTGTRVAHFSEVDASTTQDENRAFIIRPVTRLKDSTRYIVAIRNVVDASGTPIPPTPVFQALRDGTPSDDPSVANRRALYTDIFAKLKAANVSKADLQIAWDFSTASQENNTGRLVKMRDEALAQVGTDGPAYTITTVTKNPDANTAVEIDGDMTVPLYLTNPDAGSTMTLDSNNMPKQNGTATYPFLVLIPNSATKGTPGTPMQFGHGLLGDRTGARSFSKFADQLNFVVIAVDWIGLAQSDLGNVGTILSNGDASQFRSVADRLEQGILNALLAMRMVIGKFASDPAVQFNGVSAIDPSKRYYFGGSQGGIMGATYMALSTDVTRGVIDNLGQPYSLLLNRSIDFAPYLSLLQATYPNALDIQLAIALDQMLWDRSEPSGFSANITSNLLPGTPAHSVLMQVSIGDHQVTTLGAHILARAAGAVTLKPANRPIYGIKEVSSPYTGPATLVEYDFGLPAVPITDIPMTDGADPHGALAKTPGAISQAQHFLLTGEVQNFCNSGPCNLQTDGFPAP